MSDQQEQTEITDEAPISHFAMIPNLVDDMGLSPHAYRLYGHFKRVTGETGKCWQGTAKLAKTCNMSAGTVTNAKKELQEAGLIRIVVIAGEHGEYDRHEIKLVNIWKKNAEAVNRSSHERTLSPSERERSPHETKNNPIKNNPVILEEEEDVTPKQPTQPEPTPTPERPNIYRQYEASLGIMITPAISEVLKDAETTWPAEWLAEAFRLAAANNGRSWSYVKAILEGWKRNGFKADTRAPKPQTPSKGRRKSQAELLAELAAL